MWRRELAWPTADPGFTRQGDGWRFRSSLGDWLTVGATVQFVAGVACLLMLILALVGCASAGVTITNRLSSTVRLSGCDIDDALDLGPHETATDVAMTPRTGCDVYLYDGETARYYGCLVINHNESRYSIPSDVARAVTEHQCDRMR